MKTKKCILGPTFDVWSRLQHGQEKIIRFGIYHKRFPHVLRKQNGHEHRCSVGFLFMESMIKIRPFIKLDELLLTRCIELHDVPEGITGIDLPSPNKKDCNDLQEYMVFKELYKPLGRDVWTEARRCFLLQFAVANPKCFPEEARLVMQELYEKHFHEALFFDGVQRLDYLYYAYEGFAVHGNETILNEVSSNQFDRLERISKLLPGFRRVIWTNERRNFFGQHCGK